MGDRRGAIEGDAVEAMQRNLERGEPQILASYGLIGAILLLGGSGFAADQYLATKPWCLIAGLAAGLCIGFFRLARVLRRGQAEPHDPVSRRRDAP